MAKERETKKGKRKKKGKKRTEFTMSVRAKRVYELDRVAMSIYTIQTNNKIMNIEI